MGINICTCLTDRCEFNQNLTQENALETQRSITKVLYYNTITSYNYSKSNRQKLLLNSINYTNSDTLTNLNQYQFNQTDNKTILSNLATRTKQMNSINALPYLDCNILTKYIENIEIINKIIAVFRGYILRKKFNSEILDNLISFEQKFIYKYKQKIINNNPNLEKAIDKFGDKILDFQNCWKKYYSKYPKVNSSNNLKDKIFGNKIMKYKTNIKSQKFKNEYYFKINKNNQVNIKQISDDDIIHYLINNIKSFYEGECNSEKYKIKNGFGVLLKSNGEKKVGSWHNNKFEGWNYYIDINGSLFIGLFKNGKLNGKGERYNLKNEKYFGDFVNDLPDGKGKEINDLYEYEGEFKNGKKEGKGKLTYLKSGDFYEGFFSNDQFNGNGHFFWKKSGYEYFGNYVNGIIDGKGIFKYGDKAIYKGEFKNNVKEGKGELLTKNNKIIGAFKNDLPHGIGYIEDYKGFKGYAEFNEGKIIGIK